MRSPLYSGQITRLIARYRLRIDIHPAAASRLEIGFSNYGPTIGLQGTIRAIGADAFITSCKLAVVRVADHLRHEFDWAVFRQPTLFGSQQQGVELASGFDLPAQSPRRFSVQFHDAVTGDKVRQALGQLHPMWTAYLQSQGVMLAGLDPAKINPLYHAFHTAENAKIAPIHQTIDREFYWTEGQYRLTVIVRTSRPDRNFRFEYLFELTQAESAQIRLNTVGCLLATCNVPNLIFNFAFPRYALT